MKTSHITTFLVSFSGQINHVKFPAGVFDDEIYVEYDVVWGPDWKVKSGLTNGISQMCRCGKDPEKVVINMPIELVFSSTNVSGWPQIVLTVRATSTLFGDCLRGYAITLAPTTAGLRQSVCPLIRPQSATKFGEWISWFTGKYPELIDPKMLATGKENYLLRTESYGSVVISLKMVSKDIAKLGYDNRPGR